VITISVSIQHYARSAILLIVLLVARLASASQQSAADSSQPVGSARVTGRVIASDNGEPVRRAYIRLSGLAASRTKGGALTSVSRTAETDTNGDFDFANLPAGAYSITVDPVAGFVRLRPARRAAVSEVQTVHVTLHVERSGGIAGRVLDEKRDGLVGVEVHALRRINIGGYIKVEPSGRSATTDDRGKFRIVNLPAGEYYVLASYEPPRRAINPIPRLGYTTTYHPRSLTQDGAQSVVVRPGRDIEPVDVALTTRHLVRVSVRAVDSSGVPLGKEARLSLARHEPTFLHASVHFAFLPTDGMFVFDNVTPGDYALVATTSSRSEEAAYVNVTVADKDLSLNVQTNTGARISGRILVDGAPPSVGGSLASQNVHVWVRPPYGHWGISYAEAHSTETGGADRFELDGIRGPMLLDASLGFGTMVSIKRGGESIVGKTLNFIGTETIDDILVEFTTTTARLRATITRTGAADDPEPVLLILFADDRSRWHEDYGQYARATAAPRSLPESEKDNIDSDITLPPVVPGQYRIIAIHDPEMSFPTDTAILEALRPLASLVTLVAGQTATVAIGVTNVVR
jgi:Carboxypeptidase regulatory-like domain